MISFQSFFRKYDNVHEKIEIYNKSNDWTEIRKLHNLCHLCVIERHGTNGDFAHGFI